MKNEKYKVLETLDARAQEIEVLINSEQEKTIYSKVIDSIDRKSFSVFQQGYKDDLENFDPEGMFKYCDLPYWFRSNLRRVINLDLQNSKQLKILDIGIGPGHFAAICNSYGHQTMGIDLDIPFYNDLCKVLGVDRRIQRVDAGVLLPSFGVKFDLVTIMWQSFDIKKFHQDGTRTYWDNEDWFFLFNDFCQNHLEPGGAIFVELNQQKYNQDTYLGFDKNLMFACKDLGADVNTELGTIFFRQTSREMFKKK